MEKIDNSLGLGLIGFDENQKRSFFAILSLAERRLQHAWSIVELSDADFFVLAMEKSQAESIIIEQNLPRERCLFYSEHNAHEDNEILTDIGKIPRLCSLVDVINRIANAHLIKKAPLDSTVIEPTITVTPNSDNDFFDPDWGLLKHLLQNTTELLVCDFISPIGNHKLYIDSAEKIYYCGTGLKYLDSYLMFDNALVINTSSNKTSSQPNCNLNVVSQAEWESAVEISTLPARPLNNLIWYAAFRLSKGRLLRGHSDQDSVYLTRWPDLGVEGCGRYVKLAAFMRNNSVCLTTVADKTAIPLNEVYNFYNACYLIGIVEKTDKSELYTKGLDENKHQLLEKITKRLQEINNRKER
jgi:hypothetical protein